MGEIRNYENFTTEIIGGKVFYMSPGIFAHVDAITNIKDKFTLYFYDNDIKCKVYAEGLEVYLDPDNSNNFVVPDISIICDRKVKKRGYKGIPKLIVEVLSPSTAINDRKDKFKTYEKACVEEYWIADPNNKLIEQYVLEDGKYNLKALVALLDEIELSKLTEEQKASYSSIIKPTIFKNLEIDLKDIFIPLDYED